MSSYLAQQQQNQHGASHHVNKEAQLRELNKLQALSANIQVPRSTGKGYTNLDVEAFKDAIDLHVENHFETAVARQQRQHDARQLSRGMTGEQRRMFDRELGKEEERVLRAEIGGWKTDDFAVVKTLGQGGFGVVRLVQHRGSRDVYAMKQMNKSAFPKKNDLQRLMSERKCLVALSNGSPASQFFVQLYACFHDDAHLYMIMEFLQGGDLISLLCERKRLSESETRFYIAELIEALDYIHSMGFVHRDIKPDNICFSRQGHLKLLDFGLCKEVVDHWKASTDFLKTLPPQHVLCDDNDQTVTVEDYLANLENDRRRHLNSWVGTPQYMAPEIVNRETYTKSVDFWAAGVVMYDCLVGSTPFNPRVGESEPPQIQKADAVTRVIYKIQKWQHYFSKAIQRGRQANYLPSNAVDLLGCLVTPTNLRLNADQIRQHRFFHGLNFGKLLSMPAPIVPRVSSSLDTSKFPQHKEVPLPHWQNLNRSMDRIRYEAFDFTQCQAPDVHMIAAQVKNETQMPTLLEQRGQHAAATLAGNKASVKMPQVTGQYKPTRGVVPSRR
ncbi:unnamed protein product [Amoebophrya sp. A25]|nr:unnamed protein product [Amoebophrya sp. A25]|eukprot:GSA25T00002113001.1